MWVRGRNLSKRLLKDLDKWQIPIFIKDLKRIANNIPFKCIEALFYDDDSEKYDEYTKKNKVLWDASKRRDIKVGIKIYLAAGSVAIFRTRKNDSSSTIISLY